MLQARDSARANAVSARRRALHATPRARRVRGTPCCACFILRCTAHSCPSVYCSQRHYLHLGALLAHEQPRGSRICALALALALAVAAARRAACGRLAREKVAQARAFAVSLRLTVCLCFWLCLWLCCLCLWQRGGGRR